MLCVGDKLTNPAVHCLYMVVCRGHPKEGTAGGYGVPLTQAYVSSSQSGAEYGAPLTQAYVSGSQSGAEYVTQQEVQRQAEAQARVMDYHVAAPGGAVVYAVPLGDGDEPEYVAGLVFPSFLDAVWWLCAAVCWLHSSRYFGVVT